MVDYSLGERYLVISFPHSRQLHNVIWRFCCYNDISREAFFIMATLLMPLLGNEVLRMFVCLIWGFYFGSLPYQDRELCKNSPRISQFPGMRGFLWSMCSQFLLIIEKSWNYLVGKWEAICWKWKLTNFKKRFKIFCPPDELGDNSNSLIVLNCVS